MNRYIEEDAIAEQIKDLLLPISLMLNDIAQRKIENAPSIDLVRCKECKHWNNETDMTYCDRTVWFGTDADDYCSFGEVERSE